MTVNAKTEAMVAEMIHHAKLGYEIIPMFFQPLRGQSNTVSAAIRVALSRGSIIQSGLDGCGKAKYQIKTAAATHALTTTIQ